MTASACQNNSSPSRNIIADAALKSGNFLKNQWNEELARYGQRNEEVAKYGLAQMTDHKVVLLLILILI